MFFKRPIKDGAGAAARRAATMPKVPVTETARFTVTKALRQIEFVDSAYNLGVWSSDKEREDWEHDLSLMRAHDDLTAIRLELLATDNTVLFEFQILLDGGQAAQPKGARGLVDSAKGVELPILDVSLVASHRVVISHNARRAAYGHGLRKCWTKVATAPKRKGATYDSEHARAITGGRQSGAFHVSDESRRTIVVTRAGEHGYAFGKDLDTGMDSVFLHEKFAPKGTVFRPGLRLTAVLVQTPKGVQARAIQAA
jgi:hypothetical protein